MQRHFPPIMLLMLFTSLPGILIAGELQRQHGAHVHGEATGSLAMDGGEIHIELDIPGVNLAGFEHPPRTEEQSETLERVIADLESARWLIADPRAECSIEKIEIATPGFERDEGHDHGHHHDDHDGHDHNERHGDHHDHGHSHDEGHHDIDHHGHEHAEFRIKVRLECSHPASLGWIDLELFDDYPANERMRIDVLTEALATRARLTPGRTRIDLR